MSKIYNILLTVLLIIAVIVIIFSLFSGFIGNFFINKKFEYKTEIDIFCDNKGGGDTYVDNVNPSKNYGRDKYLYCGQKSYGTYEQDCSVLLKFNLSSLNSTYGEIIDAKIRLYCIKCNATINLSCYKLNDTSWDEYYVTYNNYDFNEFNGSHYLDLQCITRNDTYYYWNVTEAVKESYKNSEQFITFWIHKEQISSTDSEILWFLSREYYDSSDPVVRQPFLIVTYP